MAYIKFENIVKNYGRNVVLKNINLEIDKGQLVTLLGPSGCGKSTLLRCLAGLEEVTEGKIFLDGRNITNVNPRERDMGMVFQQYSLFPNMTVLENVEFGMKLKKTDKNEMKERAEDMLGIVGLKDKMYSYPANLSGGQQQRAALARAIVTEPKVLLLDEPLSAIDALLRKSLQAEIRRIQRELNITAIFVTHDQEEAMVMSDEIHLLYEGKIEQSAKPVELYQNPETSFAASFIGNYNLLTNEQFHNITGSRKDCEQVAIRPEMILFADHDTDMVEEAYEMTGIVENRVPHGSILRYTINVKGQNLNVDVLFQGKEMYETGKECKIVIRKSDCVYL